MSLRCRMVARRLPRPLPAALDRHTRSCLVCQAEQSRYRRLARELVRLGTDADVAPSWLTPAVLDQIGVAEANDAPAASVTKILAASAMAATAGAIAIAALRRRSAA